MAINFGFGVKLDTIALDDISILQGFRNQFAIRQWCRQHDLISESDQRKWYEKINYDHTCKMYTVSISEAPPVGVVGLTGIDAHNQVAEFSIYIDPKKQNLGYGKMALKSLLCHGFGNLNMNRIFGETFAGNPGAKMYEELGFTYEGKFRQSYFRSGKMVDSEIWSIIRDDLANLKWPVLKEVVNDTV
jgi:ribosomal-protein-alanine N-acetyltransferase